MYSVRPTTRFRRDLKRLQKRGYNLDLLDEVIQMLAEGKPLPARMRDHPLVGNYAGYRECHIAPDWLLIYKIEDDVLVLTLSRTGAHAELFGK